MVRERELKFKGKKIKSHMVKKKIACRDNQFNPWVQVNLKSKKRRQKLEQPKHIILIRDNHYSVENWLIGGFVKNTQKVNKINK